MKTAALLTLLALGVVLAPPASAADEAQARNLINSLGCKGCHRFEGRGGSRGPALDGVGNRLEAAEIRAKLLTPQAIDPESTMPAYGHLPEADINALVEFLADRR